MSRWLRDASARRPALEWLQLGVPIPAFAILLTSIIPFAVIMELTGAEPGGGLWLFGLTLAVFVAIAALGVFGPGRQLPDGQANAIIDLRLAFFTRYSMHGFFLVAQFAMGIVTQIPVLLVTSIALFAAEIGVAWLVDQRRSAAQVLDEMGGPLTPAPAPVPKS
jgi:hypothetical protein